MSERRHAILSAAARLFEHYGHGKTTIADVAREAQVGVGTVYLEFASKEAIVEQLSRDAHVDVLNTMGAASSKARDPESRFRAVMVARTRCFIEFRKKGQHACELVHCKTDGVRSAHERFRKQERALLVEVFEEGRRSGVFADFDPESVAALVQRAFASLSPPWIFGSDEEAIRDAAELSDLLLRGLLGRVTKRSRSR